MPLQILPTKLYHPAISTGLVVRAALLERLRGSVYNKVTIVSAPPGFGKTTLLAAWLTAEQDERAAWFSVDEDDNEPARFFAYFLAALRPHAPQPVQMTEPLLETLAPNPRDLVVTLLSGWEAQLPKITLILDDYHHITAQPIHSALTYLIENIPPNLRLVFISRADPPLPLGRWRAQGQLIEIRADDLRFSETEVAQFLNQTMGLSLNAADIHTLETRTEGWVAGLKLAALSLQRAANPTELIAAFAGSHRYIAEYLTDEVLSHQSEPLRDFLLQTSILERFNAPLCNHLLAINDSEAQLLALERANLFIVPLDAEANWFRYHHLFADLLQRRLAQSGAGKAAALHRRAAVWFEQNDFLLDAIRHWTAAGELSRVAALVERVSGEIWGQATLAGLMQRVESLPEVVLAEYPTLTAFLGWTWFWLGYDSERILPLLDRAERKLGNKPEAGQAVGRFQVIRSFLRRAVQNDSPGAIRLADEALARLAADDLLWRGFATLSLAAATHSLGSPLSLAEEAYGETIQLCQAAGDPTTAWIAACVRTQVVTERGELARALALNRQLLDLVRQKGSSSLVRGWAHINQAQLLYQLNDLEGARRETAVTLDLEKQIGGMPDVSLRLYALLIKLERADGNESGARAAADTLLALMKRNGVTNAIDRAYAAHAELMFRLEDWPAFVSWAQTYRPPPQPLFFPYRLATLLYGRYLIRQKAWDDGRDLLAAQLRLAREAGYVEYEMEIEIIWAILEQEAGRTTESIAAITGALQIGARSGYVRAFVDEGAVMRTILAQAQPALTDNEFRAYGAMLMAALGKETTAVLDQSSLIEPLTSREIEVLQLIAAGMSNPEIAAQLVLTVGTVKTHVKHIYEKLQVNDRVTAANKARELGVMG